MKKEIIITLILMAILSTGCSKNDTAGKSTDTSPVTKNEAVIPSENDENMTESAVSTISDETVSPTDIVSTDTNTEIFTSSTDTESPAITGATDTLPTDIVITESSDEEDIGTLDPEDFLLGEYTPFGYTKLSITDIMVFNSSYPGEDNVVVFTTGDSMMINLWCNSEACMDSVLYVVPAGTEHKNSYTADEAIIIEDMFLFFESAAGQVVGEVTIPTVDKPGVYEFRFVCEGLEEGFISFLIE